MDAVPEGTAGIFADVSHLKNIKHRDTENTEKYNMKHRDTEDTEKYKYDLFRNIYDTVFAIILFLK